MTRRRMITVTAAGVALAAPGVYALVKWSVSPKAARLSIEGPFKEYGSLPLEDLELPDGCHGFQPVRMKLSERGTIDSVFVVFTFNGEEDPSRVLHVTCVAVDHQGREITRNKEVFRDPRIEAKKPQPLGFIMDPTADISISLPTGVLFSEVRSIDLWVEEDREEVDRSI